MRLAEGQVRDVLADLAHSLIEQVLADPDPEKAQRALKAVYSMSKIDIAELRQAIDS